MYSRTRLDRQPMRVCVEEPKGDRAGKRGPAQQLLVLVAQCLSLVGMRWRLATCGRSHVSASAARRAEQASKQCSPCQVMFDSHPPSPKPTPSSSSLVQLRLPARQTRPQHSGQHLRALPSLRQASSALRADDHFHGRPARPASIARFCLSFAACLHWIVQLGQLGEKYLGPSVSSWTHSHGASSNPGSTFF